MRPWLGTFVEIATGSANLIEAGFSAVEEVHRLMSFFDPSSELSRLNRAPVGEWIELDPLLVRVLHTAHEIELLSDGAFNIAVTTWNAFEVDSHSARRVKSAQLDLGGIAKGFAVDQAVRAILARDPSAQGIVNGGGDVRVFGKGERKLHLRAETQAEPMLYELTLGNAAVATSNRPWGTFSIIASECLIADALTKVAAGAPAPVLARCLEHYGAKALLFDPDGRQGEAA